MTPDQVFVVALVAILACTAIATVLVTGLIVWLVIGRLDRLVNGWAPPRDDEDDDGGHGDGGGGDDPPPPGGPSALAADLPKPDPYRLPPLLPPSLLDALKGGRRAAPAVETPSSNQAAARLAANLRRMSGAATVEDLVVLYADPVPGHPTSCGCAGCVHRMTDWYAAAAVEDALARLLPGTGRDGGDR